MIEVRSIMTSDLLIKLCGHRLYSVSSSLDQLTDESATNQIGRSWFWGALSGNLLYRGEAQVSTCRRHMYMQGQRRCCVPWPGLIWWRDSHHSTWGMEWDHQKIHAGHTSIIMVHHITLTILNLTLYSLIQLEKLSFLLAMVIRFVIRK